MPEIKSVAAGGEDTLKSLAPTIYPGFSESFPQKLYWFLKGGYKPHMWQAAFHSSRDERGRLLRFRHLVAGRRGGKTLSAAWEVVFYCLYPSIFHMDAYGIESERPLWVWVLAKDHEVGFPARQAILQVLDESNLQVGKDYKYNKTDKKIEFENGTLLQFKSADDPQSLRGAGLDILWIDEAAFVPSREAWDVVFAALANKTAGIVITTTTPHGKNWFFEEFWSASAKRDPKQFRVEYTSLDNPFLDREVIEHARIHSHPTVFKQEFLASFDAMEGVALSGDWLLYYTVGDPGPGDIPLPRNDKGTVALRKFIGVDPAVSLADSADYFAMCLIGLSADNTQAYVLDTYKDRIQFPDQIDKIREWFLKYRPELIGIESNAYQRALEQMASRMEGLPGIVPVFSRAKKIERIMGMGPLFKIGKVRIHRDHHNFVDEWVGYDPNVRNPRDDLLDATEIALGLAGVMLPTLDFNTDVSGLIKSPSLTEEAAAQLRERREGGNRQLDPELGAMA